MKIGQFLKKMVGGAMVITALACPVFTSCYNDAALWDEIEGIHGDVATLEQKLAALEAKLNTDLQALKTLLEGQISKLEGKVDALVTVKDVKENADGSVTVTLSDNTEFTVHPKFEQDYTGLVTTTSIDGVLYWAVFDENGKAVAVTDEKGDLVPVVDVVPQVRINPETALVEISFDGGTTWQEVGYNEPCVFEGIEVVYTDNYTDEEEETYGWEETPMYVVITLPDGNTISVTFEDAASFMFGGHMGGNVGNTQYVSCGTTVDVAFMTTNIAGWIKEVPAGWKVEEIDAENAQYGGASFRITAPTEELVASGAAVAEGLLKVLAVAEGGKTITASLKLTTKAFNQLSAGKGTFTVEMNNGLGGYVVGVSTVADFDPEAIVAELAPLIEAVEESPWGSYPNWPGNNPGYDYFDQSVSDYEIANLANLPEMVLGEQYVVWALAVNYWQDANYNFGYTAGSIYSVNYNNVSLELETTKLVFNDIQVTAEFQGISMFYGRFAMKYSDASAEEHAAAILNEFNAYIDWESPMMVDDEYVDGWNNGVFTGSPNDLVSGYQSVQPGETYYLYVIPYVEGKTAYTLADMYYYEWETPALTAGGTIKVTAGEADAAYTSIVVPLAAENATYIYYAWVDAAKVSTIADKAAYLLENAVQSEGDEVSARSNSNYSLSLKPNTSAVLLAMAVDANGAYGEVFEQTYTTKTVEYNDVKFELALEGEVTDVATVKVTVTGGEPTEYYYKHYAADNYTWLNTYGGTEESASEFFATTNYNYYFNTVDALPEDGLIKLTGLDDYGKYVFVISSSTTNENGEKVFSKAKVLEFERSLDLGTIVSAKDDNGNENADWAAVKPVVEYSLEVIGDFSAVSWTVSDIPEGWSGFTATVESEYTATYASDKDLITFLVMNEFDFATKFDLVSGRTYHNNSLYGNGTTEYDLYVVLVDPQGNYYAPYKWTFTALKAGFGM